MNEEWKSRRSGPQYMNADGSYGNSKPDYLRPLPPKAPVKPAGIHLSEEAAKKIADALRIFLHEPSGRTKRTR